MGMRARRATGRLRRAIRPARSAGMAVPHPPARAAAGAPNEPTPTRPSPSDTPTADPASIRHRDPSCVEAYAPAQVDATTTPQAAMPPPTNTVRRVDSDNPTESPKKPTTALTAAPINATAATATAPRTAATTAQTPASQAARSTVRASMGLQKRVRSPAPGRRPLSGPMPMPKLPHDGRRAGDR